MSSSSEPDVILFERSPYGNVDAIVETDGQAVYFYLAGQKFPTRSCWVGNLVQGPLVIDHERMKQGMPPVLPRIHCTHPTGRDLPTADDLHIVWFEEGNGAALIEAGQCLAVIPPWSGTDGFHGYSRDCIAQTPVAWPMPTETLLDLRIKQAHDFWDQVGGNLFAELQTRLLRKYESRFGNQANYWAIDNNTFPPRGMVQLDRTDKTTLLTVGMSVVPQPNVELFVERPSHFRRVELGIQTETEKATEAWIAKAGQYLASLAKQPWDSFSWFGNGHTCDWNLNDNPNTPHAVFWTDSQPTLDFRGDPVYTLWLVPISRPELEEITQQKFELFESNSFRDRVPA